MWAGSFCWTNELGFVTSLRIVQEVFRRSGSGGMFDNRFYLYCFFSLLSRECLEEQGHARKTARSVVIHAGIRMWCLCFTYAPVSTASLILVREPGAKLRGGASE